LQKKTPKNNKIMKERLFPGSTTFARRLFTINKKRLNMLQPFFKSFADSKIDYSSSSPFPVSSFWRAAMIGSATILGIVS
jgi:hypothetical protein